MFRDYHRKSIKLTTALSCYRYLLGTGCEPRYGVCVVLCNLIYFITVIEETLSGICGVYDFCVQLNARFLIYNKVQ